MTPLSLLTQQVHSTAELCLRGVIDTAESMKIHFCKWSSATRQKFIYNHILSFSVLIYIYISIYSSVFFPKIPLLYQCTSLLSLYCRRWYLIDMRYVMLWICLFLYLIYVILYSCLPKTKHIHPYNMPSNTVFKPYLNPRPAGLASLHRGGRGSS